MPVSASAALAAITNPYGLASLWAQGDWVIKGVALILLFMSLISWYLIVSRALRNLLLARTARRWLAAMPAELDALLAHARTGDPYGSLIERLHDAWAQYQRSPAARRGRLQLDDWLASHARAALDVAGARLQGGLGILASVGATAPFIGLFGTVWGIYHALIAIGVSGTASIDKVAGPVGEALIMTAFGLAVAIPAVLGYNALVRANRTTLGHLRALAHRLCTAWLSEQGSDSGHG